MTYSIFLRISSLGSRPRRLPIFVATLCLSMRVEGITWWPVLHLAAERLSFLGATFSPVMEIHLLTPCLILVGAMAMILSAVCSLTTKPISNAGMYAPVVVDATLPVTRLAMLSWILSLSLLVSTFCKRHPTFDIQKLMFESFFSWSATKLVVDRS